MRTSADTGPDSTGYGRHILELGSRHNLVINNGMAQWPTLGALTCFPLGGARGGSTVDYILGSRETAHIVTSFTIPPRPVGADHTYLLFSLVSPPPAPSTHTPMSHTTFHFTWDLADVYDHHVHMGIYHMDPSAP